MFQLTSEEYEELRFQFETSKARGGRRYLPYVFTEQGVAMLSGILNSDKAIQMNIAIMRAFVEVRRILSRENDLKEQFKLIKEQLGNHDAQLNQLYDAMENLLDEKAMQKKWEERELIGFKTEPPEPIRNKSKAILYSILHFGTFVRKPWDVCLLIVG